MSKSSFSIALSFALVCTGCMEKEYHALIFSKGDGSLKVDTVTFTQPDDTTAFKYAVDRYWSHRGAALKTNRMVRNDGPVPFKFMLLDEQWYLVDLSEAEKERLAKKTVTYFRDSVLPFIDTITPFSDRPKEVEADIYN